ncbi:unnamed protein product [Caenorhabditis nigoni]
MPFPVLRAPSVVLSEIISLLEPNEIVTASFCSKNLKHRLKKHFPRGKSLAWRLTMTDHTSRGRVDIETSEVDEQITVISAEHTSELKGHKLRYINRYKRSEKCPVLYFNDQVKGTKWIVKYVTDLFSIGISSLLLVRNGTWAIDWVNNRQGKKLHDFGWFEDPKCNSDADKTVDYVLRNSRASNFCSIEGSVSDNFKFDGKLGPMRQLYFPSNGHWITLNNLINFDSIEITVRGSRLSVSDLNSFLRHWRVGGSSRLKWLELNFENLTLQVKFDEDLEVLKTTEERLYRRSCFFH